MEAIWLFTAERWSLKQAEVYVEGLNGTFGLIAQNPKLGVLRREVEPPVRVHSHKSHMIIYRETDQGFRIERILHARQNWRALIGG